MNSGNWIFNDNGYDKNLVYFPGWATDISFLRREKLPFNLIYPDSLITVEHLQTLNNLLTAPTYILGWSLGGYLALQFADLYPDKVSALVIASIRLEYPREIITPMRRAELSEMRAVQKKFYRQAFFPSMLSEYRAFKQHEDEVAETMYHALLLTGLDYLENNSPGDNPPVATTYLHGGKDVIAPVAEGIAWAEKNNVEYIVIPDAPHMLTYCDIFYEIINDKLK